MSATTDTSRMSPRFAAVPASMEDRLGMWLAAGGVVIVVVAAVFYLTLALQWRSQAFLGVMLTRTLTVDDTRPLAPERWGGLNSGLQRGDHIIAIDGVTFPTDYVGAEQAFNSVMQTLSPGDVVRIRFERTSTTGRVSMNNREGCTAVQNGVATCDVRYQIGGYPDIDFIAAFVVPLIAGVVTLVVGIGVLALRARKLTAQIVAGVCLMLSVFMIGIFDTNTTRQLTPFWITGTTLVGTMMGLMALSFPTKLPVLYRRPTVQWLPVAVGVIEAAAILALYFAPPSPQAAIVTLWLPLGAGLIGMVVLVLALLRRRDAAASIAIRDQANTVLIGMFLSLVIGVVWVLNVGARVLLRADLIPLNLSAATPFLVLTPLSMAYAVLQYRSRDTDRVISGALTYGMMLIALLAGYFLLLLSASLVAGQIIGATNPILLAILIFLMAVLFIPLRTQLQARVDNIYYRKRQNYQRRLEEFGQRLSALIEFEDILNAYRNEIDQALTPIQFFIFLPERQSGEYAAQGTDIRFEPDSPLLQSLLATGDGMIYLEAGQPWIPAAVAERSRLLLLKASLIASLRGSSRLSGFVVIAPPRSQREGYTFEELRFVQALTAQISVAVERAEVVDTLEARVRELDVLSQVSQAVNFSIDLNDLLELIYAQTVRLIEATHFYITLRDPDTNELYHAFFLEDGERYENKENRRWNVANDLFSEIVRNGQPISVANYAAALAERGASSVFEDVQMQAWLGVPMQAGGRTIGVLSVGTTQPGRSYSDDQRKIFADISALAATSLDKARLFAETNVRARQLAALNDITRQIVAAELDVEKLLQLITASATEILGAAAGSLLLTTDDGSEDLEFRVAIGGSGSELIGSRIPAGRGLVGEVATTGKPVIVQDVNTDPRWGGELSKGAFKTSNIVAVPLVTQNRVIGVLEVLNKRNKGTFNRDDVDLLTAFAGQAAVAIENARLFQMTDLQLSERLSELEMLERIDVELNRSLDVTKVAEISLHWAMENSGATAGLIGMVAGEPPMLNVIYKVGYDDADLPEGMESGRWPLDRGIASRVLRTKQPDLAPDVSIDPDYEPALQGALSQITLPMLSGGSVNAMLILETNREPRLRLSAMPFLQRLTEHASIAIVNAQLYAELTRANESKSEFVSFVAHELKNPLTSIQGYSDVLLTGVAGTMSDQQKNFLSTIRSNAERMNTLVSDLNDVTKLQTDNLRMEFAPVDCNAALQETLRPLQKQIEDKHQTLELDLPKDMPPIQADQNRLIQVLTNLVSNAHKYTPPDGKIRIAARVEEDARDNKGRQLDPQLHISITDTGIGMSEEDLHRLFTAYFRSDNPLAREQPGTGLGLTITRGIIERHGGQIWVESELGKGTSFHFTVPLLAQAEKAGK
jgi:signal transduction histidine kinase